MFLFFLRYSTCTLLLHMTARQQVPLLISRSAYDLRKEEKNKKKKMTVPTEHCPTDRRFAPVITCRSSRTIFNLSMSDSRLIIMKNSYIRRDVNNFLVFDEDTSREKPFSPKFFVIRSDPMQSHLLVFGNIMLAFRHNLFVQIYSRILRNCGELQCTFIFS